MTKNSLTLISGLLLASAGGSTWAQGYPNKTIRMVVPFAAGGNTDIIARIVAPEMSKQFGQQIVIDNRGGGGSVIGSEIAAKSPPDGYTLLMVSAAHVINPAMIKKLPYDSIRDFSPISVVADVPTAFVVHPALPVKNVKEFVALARSKPGELNYSTAGRGTVGHLAAELLSSTAKIKMVHVPYKGSGPSIIDLMAGHVQLQMSSMPAVINYAKAGKLRMIAQTGSTRSVAAAHVPTMEESGLKGFVVSSGFGLLAPANTPRPVIDRVHGVLVKTLADATVKNSLSGQGAEPVGNRPEEYEAFNKSEIAKWIKVTRDAGIPPE
ncbi:MAG TPA: tripartite tricarboxylate transporter substrate binding protein [Burkholderiales bacterium]|nr:tripartite tricarboxylate transporter substrate binding protein [Burkholderiales bacterium]